MRIAFAGTHRAGKSTLLERVAEALHDHVTVDEPYYLLEEDGYEASSDPSLEDFEAQLERSLEVVEDGEADVLFDRSPADILGYLTTHEDSGAFDEQDWMQHVREGMQSLDLVVFVPIEEPDRIALPAHENAELRLAVHEKLHELIVERSIGFDTEVLVVSGGLEARAKQVLSRVRERSR